MTFTEAATKGLSLRPKRATGVYFSGGERSDVLGAAYQGLTGDTSGDNYKVGDLLDREFPVLSKKVNYPDDATKTGTVKEVVRYLNDERGWKRKNTIRFVQSIEQRLN